MAVAVRTARVGLLGLVAASAWFAALPSPGPSTAFFAVAFLAAFVAGVGSAWSP